MQRSSVARAVVGLYSYFGLCFRLFAHGRPASLPKLLTGLALRPPLAAQLQSAVSPGRECSTRALPGPDTPVLSSCLVGVRPALNAEAQCEMLDNSKPKLLTPSGPLPCCQLAMEITSRFFVALAHQARVARAEKAARAARKAKAAWMGHLPLVPF